MAAFVFKTVKDIKDEMKLWLPAVTTSQEESISRWINAANRSVTASGTFHWDDGSVPALDDLQEPPMPEEHRDTIFWKALTYASHYREGISRESIEREYRDSLIRLGDAEFWKAFNVNAPNLKELKTYKELKAFTNLHIYPVRLPGEMQYDPVSERQGVPTYINLAYRDIWNMNYWDWRYDDDDVEATFELLEDDTDVPLVPQYYRDIIVWRVLSAYVRSHNIRWPGKAEELFQAEFDALINQPRTAAATPKRNNLLWPTGAFTPLFFDNTDDLTDF